MCVCVLCVCVVRIYHCRTLLCKVYGNKSDDIAFLFIHMIFSYIYFLWLTCIVGLPIQLRISWQAQKYSMQIKAKTPCMVTILYIIIQCSLMKYYSKGLGGFWCTNYTQYLIMVLISPSTPSQLQDTYYCIHVCVHP